MKEKHEFVLNTVLIAVIVGLASWLVWNTVSTPGKPDLVIIDPSPEMEPFPAAAEAAAMATVFDQRDIFGLIVTPKPTPTPVVVPTPTPPPPVFAEWRVVLIISDSVQILDRQGAMHYLKEGDRLEGAKVVEVSYERGGIRVRNEADGREKWLWTKERPLGRNTGSRQGREQLGGTRPVPGGR